MHSTQIDFVINNEEINDENTSKVLREEMMRKFNDIYKLKQKIICTDALIKETNNKYKDNEQLRQRLEICDQLIENYKNEVEKLSFELQSTLGELTPLRKENELGAKKAKTLQTEIDNLNRQLDSYMGLSHQSEAANSIKDSRLGTLEHEIRELKSVNKKLELSLHKARASLELKNIELQQMKMSDKSETKLISKNRPKNLESKGCRSRKKSSPLKVDNFLNNLQPNYPLISPIPSEADCSNTSDSVDYRDEDDIQTTNIKINAINNSQSKNISNLNENKLLKYSSQQLNVNYKSNSTCKNRKTTSHFKPRVDLLELTKAKHPDTLDNDNTEYSNLNHRNVATRMNKLTNKINIEESNTNNAETKSYNKIKLYDMLNNDKATGTNKSLNDINMTNISTVTNISHTENLPYSNNLLADSEFLTNSYSDGLSPDLHPNLSHSLVTCEEILGTLTDSSCSDGENDFGIVDCKKLQSKGSNYSNLNATIDPQICKKDNFKSNIDSKIVTLNMVNNSSTDNTDVNQIDDKSFINFYNRAPLADFNTNLNDICVAESVDLSSEDEDITECLIYDNSQIDVLNVKNINAIDEHEEPVNNFEAFCLRPSEIGQFPLTSKSMVVSTSNPLNYITNSETNVILVKPKTNCDTMDFNYIDYSESFAADDSNNFENNKKMDSINELDSVKEVDDINASAFNKDNISELTSPELTFNFNALKSNISDSLAIDDSVQIFLNKCDATNKIIKNTSNIKCKNAMMCTMSLRKRNNSNSCQLESTNSYSNKQIVEIKSNQTTSKLIGEEILRNINVRERKSHVHKTLSPCINTEGSSSNTNHMVPLNKNSTIEDNSFTLNANLNEELYNKILNCYSEDSNSIIDDDILNSVISSEDVVNPKKKKVPTATLR